MRLVPCEGLMPTMPHAFVDCVLFDSLQAVSSFDGLAGINCRREIHRRLRRVKSISSWSKKPDHFGLFLYYMTDSVILTPPPENSLHISLWTFSTQRRVRMVNALQASLIPAPKHDKWQQIGSPKND